MTKNLWILTEERPKKEVIGQILNKFTEGQGIAAFFDSLRIIPVLDKSSNFTSTYKVVGLTSPAIENIFLLIISGNSSFVDYLIYYQKEKPTPANRPIFAIEETKTDDSESRNTGIYQRATKFVYIDVFYPGIDTTMLYNLQILQKSTPTKTNIFGTRCFRTLGVNFTGKSENQESLEAWNSIDELIDYKSRMKSPPSGNIPILIEKINDELITISGRLVKRSKTNVAGSLSHDPNIGALSLIAATLRKLGWKKRIQVIQHGLTENMVKPSNKFIQIANHLDIEIQGIDVPQANFPLDYWQYETTGEKLGTIFLHLVVEEFSQGFAIYENHAGCERGYFFTAAGKPIAIGKRLSDDNGHMAKEAEKIALPDLIFIDNDELKIINVEGERSVNVLTGIKQIGTFENIERTYIMRYYPNHEISRTVVLFGGNSERIEHIEVSVLLNSNGKIVLGVQTPQLFRDAVNNLVAFWQPIE